MKVSEIRILFSVTMLSLRRNAGKKKPFILCKTSVFLITCWLLTCYKMLIFVLFTSRVILVLLWRSH